MCWFVWYAHSFFMDTLLTSVSPWDLSSILISSIVQIKSSQLRTTCVHFLWGYVFISFLWNFYIFNKESAYLFSSTSTCIVLLHRLFFTVLGVTFPEISL